MFFFPIEVKSRPKVLLFFAFLCNLSSLNLSSFISQILCFCAGVECTDTVLMEIKRTVAMDCTRRPLRMFQRIEDKGAAKHDDDRGGANSASNNPNNPNAATNTNKEPVCEAMNKKQFMECLHQINPAITTQEVRFCALHVGEQL